MKLTLAFVFCLVVASTSASVFSTALKEIKGIAAIKNLPAVTTQVEHTALETSKKFEKTIENIVAKVKARIAKTDKSIINKNQSAITKLAGEVTVNGGKCIAKFSSDLIGGLAALVQRAINAKATSINIADLKIPAAESTAAACIKQVQDTIYASLDKLHVYRI